MVGKEAHPTRGSAQPRAGGGPGSGSPAQRLDLRRSPRPAVPALPGVCTGARFFPAVRGLGRPAWTFGSREGEGRDGDEQRKGTSSFSRHVVK